MNFIALALLRAMGSEEDAFWTLCGLATNILPYYYTAAMSGTSIDLKMLSQLVKERLPAVHEHFKILECPLDLLLSQWLLPVFSTSDHGPQTS